MVDGCCCLEEKKQSMINDVMLTTMMMMKKFYNLQKTDTYTLEDEAACFFSFLFLTFFQSSIFVVCIYSGHTMC